MELYERVLANKIKLQKSKPFWAYLLLNLNIKEADEKMAKMLKKVGGLACIDPYGNLTYNKDWFNKLNDEQMKFVLIHEIAHMFLFHLMRKGKRIYEDVYRIAVDLAVNNILINDGMESPKEGLVPYNNQYEFKDEKGKTRKDKNNKPLVIKDLNNKSWEHIYDELKRKIPKNILKKMKGFDYHILVVENDKDGKGKDEKGIIKVSKGDFEKLQKKWKRALAGAVAHCQNRGDMPAGMERFIDDLLDSKVNWKHMLQKYIVSQLPCDYSYSFPSKRSISSGFYMPHLLRETLDIVVSVDTSGSIDKETLTTFLSECVAIAKSFVNLRMHLIVCDCEIKEVLEVTNGNIQKIMNLRPKGGGGTDHKTIFNYIEKKLPNSRILVALTDGYTSFPNKKDIPFNLKTLWIITPNGCNEKDIPFGETIKLR